MRFELTKETRSRLLVNVLVVLTGISFYFALLNIDEISGFVRTVMGILRPFIYGFVLAFLLDSPVKHFEKILKRYIKHAKMQRALAVVLGMVLFFFIVGLLIAVLVPQLMESVVMLVKNIQDFASNLEVYIAELTRVLQQEYHLDPALYESLTKTGEDILGLGSALLLSGFQRLLGLTGQLTTWVWISL